jgi:hypothetical protein
VSIKRAIDLFQKMTVSGTDSEVALTQASLKFAITRKRLVRAMRAKMLSEAEKKLRDFVARIPQISSEILQARIRGFEKTVDNLDKKPESPLQVLRQAHIDAISAARNEVERRKNN